MQNRHRDERVLGIILDQEDPHTDRGQKAAVATVHFSLSKASAVPYRPCLTSAPDLMPFTRLSERNVPTSARPSGHEPWPHDCSVNATVWMGKAPSGKNQLSCQIAASPFTVRQLYALALAADATNPRSRLKAPGK